MSIDWWKEYSQRTTCEHTETEPTTATKSNGAKCVYLQCRTCGEKVREVPKNGYDVQSLPEFDAEFRDRVRQRNSDLREQMRLDAQAELDQQRADESAAWWLRYTAYLKTPHWAALRRRVIARDNFQCQGCGRRIGDAEAEVHHLSYATFNLVGWSLPGECQALCRTCHDSITVASRRNQAKP